MEKRLKGDFKEVEYEFELDKMKLTLVHNGKKYEKELLDTKNGKLIEAFKSGNVFLDTPEEELFLDKTLYYCSRSVLVTFSGDAEVYMDVLLYNDEKDVIYPGALNRSQGHCNQKQQVEYHQVMDGEIISICTSPEGESYYGFFGKGDYIHVPKGWFHCTYVVKAPAIVANFYCNTPWGDRVECKPYFSIDNEFSVERSLKPDQFVLKKKGCDTQVLISKENVKPFDELGISTYDYLKKEKKVRTQYPNDNIFDFIYKLDLTKE